MPVPGRPHRTVSCICSGVSWVARKLAAAPPYPPPPTPDHLWHPTQFADLKIRMPSSARGPSAHAGPAVDRTHAANRTHAAARLHARGTNDHPATLDFSPFFRRSGRACGPPGFKPQSTAKTNNAELGRMVFSSGVASINHLSQAPPCPTRIATYCFPSVVKVIGGALTPPPVLKLH